MASRIETAKIFFASFSKTSLITMVILLLSSCKNGEQVEANSLVSASLERNSPGTEVVKIWDGDTIDILQDGNLFRVRLACIDTPELSQQPWGNSATQRLQQLLPLHQKVRLRVTGIDRYNRHVVEVFRGQDSINLQMVAEGQAVVYRKYLEACAQTQEQYLQAEENAKIRHLGFWNQSNPMMPWDFRYRRRPKKRLMFQRFP